VALVVAELSLSIDSTSSDPQFSVSLSWTEEELSMFSLVHRQNDSSKCAAYSLVADQARNIGLSQRAWSALLHLVNSVTATGVLGTKWLDGRDISTFSQRALVRLGFAFGAGVDGSFRSLTFAEILDVKFVRDGATAVKVGCCEPRDKAGLRRASALPDYHIVETSVEVSSK